ncbi:hypothetical protein [Streptomyces sp. CB01373]|uniref:hypothetical protein n=1 Tax=Streptomyces sp. CB01373 TaxID=2020325 RepID=UPI000C274723|nr:hypothetical protein [Streptomyces sp. CB01373]PJM94015.1 hypothetical protein CG719_21330 [Streptomyces sp. CB01373]
MDFLHDLTLVRCEKPLTNKAGTTCSGEASVANAVEWELRLPGRPTLTLHDNHWANGEQDLVLHKPAVVPEMPAALSRLHDRLRSGVTVGRQRREKRLMVYPTHVDEHEWPRIKKSFTTAELAGRLGLHHLCELTAREGVDLDHAFDRPRLDLPPVDLDDPQDEKRVQHALFFPVEDDETPVVAYVHFRVAPVLRHVGWLSPADS